MNMIDNSCNTFPFFVNPERDDKLILHEQDFKNTICWMCGAKIVEYFEIKYAGIRGKCLICEIDFPLE